MGSPVFELPGHLAERADDVSDQSPELVFDCKWFVVRVDDGGACDARFDFVAFVKYDARPGPGSGLRYRAALRTLGHLPSRGLVRRFRRPGSAAVDPDDSRRAAQGLADVGASHQRGEPAEVAGRARERLDDAPDLRAAGLVGGWIGDVACQIAENADQLVVPADQRAQRALDGGKVFRCRFADPVQGLAKGTLDEFRRCFEPVCSVGVRGRDAQRRRM